MRITGNPVLFSAIKPVGIEGRAVLFLAPRAWIVRATGSGLRPVLISHAGRDGIEELTPAP